MKRLDGFHTTLFLSILSILSLGFVGACGDDGGGDGGADARANSDGAVGADAMQTPDAMQGQPDAEPPPSGMHLLISEVALTDGDHEFVEIYNPGTQTVSLANYYLADDGEYWRLPSIYSQLDPATQPWPVINPDFDFIAKFPDSASIGPGQVKTIAMRYNEYEVSYGMAADYAFLDAPNADVAMVDAGAPQGVQLMGLTPQLTNVGEAIVLFYWDGASDLVADVDLLNAGNGLSPSNRLESKDGESLDGPDADLEVTPFGPETGDANIQEIDAAAGVGFSHKRILLEEGHETQTGAGNGITGDDEMSEDLSMTWDNGATFSAPTPGQVPGSLIP